MLRSHLARYWSGLGLLATQSNAALLNLSLAGRFPALRAHLRASCRSDRRGACVLSGRIDALTPTGLS